MIPHWTHRSARKIVCLISLVLTASGAKAQAPFHLLEATIDGIHSELRTGRLTCVQLVQAYLNRIDAYDQSGPTLNAIQNVNRNALMQAAQLDEQLKAGSNPTGKLHCIPVLLKDQVDTNFMPTTYGSALFKTFVPERNATIVDRLQAAGAIILAKTNMGEFAFAYSGSAFGDCHNAYAPDRSPSGSSCGTGAGIAANFGAVGIGEDTGGSVRGPAAHNNLVGLRPTLQLVSRAGMLPATPTRDTLGPITRTVRDAAIVLDVIAGYDPKDPLTAWSYGEVPNTYTSFLVPDGLKGMRIGVIRVPTDNSTDTKAPDYQETQAAITKAVADMRARGAEVVDPLDIPNLKGLVNAAGGGETYEPEQAINAFLAQHPNSPVHTFRELADSNVVNPRRREGLKKGVGHTTNELGHLGEMLARDDLRTAILQAMADNRLDALFYATYDHAPAAVPKSTPGTNRRLAASLSFPAISVPGGFFADGLPIGLEFLARPFAESTLIKAAFDYEQATKNRRPPSTVPALTSEP
jgi:Asp-tRNA(Asn)/Glu-tRNA(Gln) amidotransferase A subunit family amidase